MTVVRLNQNATPNTMLKVKGLTTKNLMSLGPLGGIDSGCLEANKGESMTPEKTNAVESELRRFAQDLNLSEPQKEKLRTHLSGAKNKLQEFMQQNPNVSRQDIVKKVISARSSIREELVKFLTPPQLQKWDAEVVKAKEFLGHSVAA
jgi:protein CpxP